jgi:hypothetical protein
MGLLSEQMDMPVLFIMEEQQKYVTHVDYE